MNQRIPDGKEIRLPNGDVGIVQGFDVSVGKYQVVPNHGIGKMKLMDPEELAPEVAMQQLGDQVIERLPGF